MNKPKNIDDTKTISGKGITDGYAVGVIKNRSLSKTLVAIIFFVGLIILLALLYFLSPAFNRVVKNGLNNASIAINGSCDGDKLLILDYNEAVQKDGLSKLLPIADRIKAKKGYLDDPTCMYILTSATYGSGFLSEAPKIYERLTQLEQSGKSPSKDINDGVNRESMYKLIKIIGEEQKEGRSGPNDGQG